METCGCPIRLVGMQINRKVKKIVCSTDCLSSYLKKSFSPRLGQITLVSVGTYANLV